MTDEFITIQMNGIEKCAPHAKILTKETSDFKQTRRVVCKGRNNKEIPLYLQINKNMAYPDFDNAGRLTITPTNEWLPTYGRITDSMKGHGCKPPFFICAEEMYHGKVKGECSTFKTTCKN